MKQIALDSPLKKLSSDALTVQIGCAESPLASLLFVLSFYGESLCGCGFETILSTITANPQKYQTVYSKKKKIITLRYKDNNVEVVLNQNQCLASKCNVLVRPKNTINSPS